MATIGQIITDYKKRKRSGLDTWLTDCATTRDLLTVIEMSALARDLDNDKHPHQHRLPNSLLQKFADRLLRKSYEIVRVKSFDKLYEIVRSSALKGIGDLTVYDTAHRIGTRLRVWPDKIYLHQGTRVGAEKLLGRKIKEPFIERKTLKEFKHLSCEDIEDILCIYKDFFPLRNTKSLASKSAC